MKTAEDYEKQLRIERIEHGEEAAKLKRQLGAAVAKYKKFKAENAELREAARG